MMEETNKSTTIPSPNFFIDKCKDIVLQYKNDSKTCHVELNNYFREVLKALKYESIEVLFDDLPDWYIMICICYCLRERSQEIPSVKWPDCNMNHI